MNLNQKSSIVFWLKKDEMNKQGLVPIWIRITIDGKRAEFSTQQQICLKHWDNENAVVAREFREARSINDYLTLIKVILSDTIIYKLATKIL